MLPFEDRWSRQRRLLEVGTEGQGRIASQPMVVALHAGLVVERDYLARAGVPETLVDPGAPPLSFPFAQHFEFAAPLAVTNGAWCALARIRQALGVG